MATINTSGVTNPAPAACYQTQRLSTNPTALTYTINVGPPGNNAAYTLRLHFAELTFNSAGSRTFNVLVNGANWLTNFDIFAAAGNAKNKAVVETRTVHSDSMGNIKITFLPIVNNPTVNAIEILNPTSTVLGNDRPLPAWAEDAIPLDSVDAGDSGPSAAHAVNLASGVYENLPDVDVVAHNQYGDAPVFMRRYRTANAALGYSSPGLPLGWTHNYDLYVTGTPGTCDGGRQQ
jgi:hypothetical protein